MKLLSKAQGYVALRVGEVENKHISWKNSPRRKKNAHREVQMCNGKVQALKKAVIMQPKRMGCHEPALTRLSPCNAWRKSAGLFPLRQPENNLKCLEIFATFHARAKSQGAKTCLQEQVFIEYK